MPDEPIPRLYRSLLVSIYKYFEDEDTANGQITEGQLRYLKKYGANPGIARAGLQWLVEQEYLEKLKNTDQDESWLYWEFTHKGALTVDSLLSVEDISNEAAALRLNNTNADSIIDLSSDSTLVEKVNANLKQIAQYIATNNEFDMDASERAAVTAEINSFRTVLESKTIRAAVLINAIRTNGLLNFLREKIPDKAVGALVSVVISSIAKWLGL